MVTRPANEPRQPVEQARAEHLPLRAQGRPEAPGGVAGDLSPEGNVAGWLDRNYLPGRILPEYYGHGDNEGYLSTIPSVATVLLGARQVGKSTLAGAAFAGRSGYCDSRRHQATKPVPQ